MFNKVTYSYGFEGELDVAKISQYEKECSSFQQVAEVKIKYKSDSKRGEMIIQIQKINKEDRREDSPQFQPVQIKKFLLEKGLTPLNFKEIKK